MKLSVQFPMHTRSENDARSLPFAVARVAKTRGVKAANGLAIAIAQRTAKQRREVRMILDSQLPRLCRLVRRDDGRDAMNFYRVTLIRISAGVLDDDGLKGALKAVRDEVAAWLGCGDGPRDPASWRYGQQKGPAKVYAVRIEIEDDDQDQREVHKIVGPAIPKLGPVIGDVQHSERTRTAAPVLLMSELNGPYTPDEGAPSPTCSACVAAISEAEGKLGGEAIDRRLSMRSGRGAHERRAPKQAPLVFLRSYYALPGQDEDADEVTLEELTGPLFEVEQPPPRIIKGGRVLVRSQDFHPALGEHWIYEAAPSAARPSPRQERAEARR